MHRMLSKTITCLLLLLCIPVLGFGESPNVFEVTPTFYNSANDIAEEFSSMRNQSDEVLQSMRKGTFAASLLPLNDQLLLWYGVFEYHDIAREESFKISYDREMPRSDAYAVAVDLDGNRVWSLRISDPQSENAFSNAWMMDDGRILLKFSDFLGEWGSQYYVVSQDGEVQEMLPAYKAKEYGAYETLNPVTGGYFGGGEFVDQSGYGPMIEEVNLTYFDSDLNMVWTVDDEAFLTASLPLIVEAGNSIILAGGIWSTYIPNNPSLDNPINLTPMVAKLNLQGETEWIYQGHKYAVATVGDAVLTEDGGVLFATWADPTMPTVSDQGDKGTLVKLSHVGTVEWVRQYHDDYGFTSFESIAPHNDGFFVSGRTEGDLSSIAVLYIDDDGTPGLRIDIDIDGVAATGLSLAKNSNGDIYAYGATMIRESETVGMDEKTAYRPFHIIVSEVAIPDM